jgi:hypothetical protein
LKIRKEPKCSRDRERHCMEFAGIKMYVAGDSGNGFGNS